ncbi:MAG: hypothetical protein OXH75_21490 [Acidobacteria bacterium]|nr:hypothetical protein [Acidobacteriota bacterium]
MEAAEQIVGLLSLLVNTLVSAAIGFAVAVLVLRGPKLLLRARGAQKAGDYAPSNYILFVIPMFALLVTGIFVFMTFRIDRGARQEARETAIEYVASNARQTAQETAATVATNAAQSTATAIAEATAEDIAAATAEDIAATTAERVAESRVREIAETTAQSTAREAAERVATEIAKTLADRALEDVAEQLANQLADIQDIAERVAENMAERVVEEAGERIAELVATLSALVDASTDTSALLRWTETYWRAITDVPSEANELDIGTSLVAEWGREETAWLYFTVPADGRYEVSARAQAFFTDTVLALYSVIGDELNYIGYNDDGNEDSLDALYSAVLSEHVTYYVGVSDAFGGTGRVSVSVERVTAVAGGIGSGLSVEYGDDTSDASRDGECDDPRFEGDGMATVLFVENRGRDAADCRRLYGAGRIRLHGVDRDSGDIDFGDDTSRWAQDGECDDLRFVGEGMASTLLYSGRSRDASDCRRLYNAGRIRLFGADTNDIR